MDCARLLKAFSFKSMSMVVISWCNVNLDYRGDNIMKLNYDFIWINFKLSLTFDLNRNAYLEFMYLKIFVVV